MKYIVTDFHTNFNGHDGTTTHIFNGEDSLENRKEAIAKAKEIMLRYEGDSRFVSPLFARLKNYQDVWAYSIEIYAEDEQGNDYPIFIEDELDIQLEAMEQEMYYYEEQGIDISTTFCDGEDNCYNVLDHELDFLVRKHLEDVPFYNEE